VVRAIEERLVRVTRQSALAQDDELDSLFERLAQNAGSGRALPG